ncbi:MAG: hypothetical protein LBT10_05710 [Methanobrevibacter sp.]|nr:hypothetical protein [Methanobrevibacter sp.]
MKMKYLAIAILAIFVISLSSVNAFYIGECTFNVTNGPPSGYGNQYSALPTTNVSIMDFSLYGYPIGILIDRKLVQPNGTVNFTINDTNQKIVYTYPDGSTQVINIINWNTQNSKFYYYGSLYFFKYTDGYYYSYTNLNNKLTPIQF